MSYETNSKIPTSRKLRATLLAGACALGVVGAGVSQNVFFNATPAHAQTAPLANAVQPGAPASFADVVDQVRPAVVSVKVKVETASSLGGTASADDDGEGVQGLPPGLPPGHREVLPPSSASPARIGQRSPFGQNGPQSPRGKQFGQAQGSGLLHLAGRLRRHQQPRRRARASRCT